MEYVCCQAAHVNESVDDENVDFSDSNNIVSNMYCFFCTGVPMFQACLNLTEGGKCSRTDPPILFYVGKELDITVPVVYIGAGPFGALFSVSLVTLLRPDFGELMSCTVPPSMDSDSEVTCSANPDVKERICVNVTTDFTSFVNTSFVINSTNVDDMGEYIVRVAGRDIVTMTTTFTTITMTLSASATLHPRKYEEA